MSPQQWRVFVNDKWYGPATAQQLRQLADQGKITRETLVVADEMEKPVAASRVSGLFDASSGAQSTSLPEVRKPPIVAPRPNIPAVITVASSVTKSEQKQIAISPTMLAAWLLVGVLAAFAATFIVCYSRSRHQAEVAAADAQTSKSIADAKAWVAGGSPLDVALVEQALSKALQNELTTKKADAEAALNQVRERRLVVAADSVFDQARQHLDGMQVPEAILLLRKYVIDPRATNRTEAQRLLDEAEVAISETEMQKSVASMTDDQLAAAGHSLGPGNSLSPEIPDGRVTDPALKRIRAEIASRHLVTEIQRRNELRVAAEKRLEAERLAAIERQREAEEVRREADEAKKLQAERAQAEKLAADQAAARAAAMQQAAQEEAINAMIEEHNDLVNAKVVRWGSTLQRSDRVKFNEPMLTVVRLSKAMSQYTKAELIETFQVILERPDLPVMEEFMDRSGFGESIVKVKADGKTRTLNDAWTYGVSLVIKEGPKGK